MGNTFTIYSSNIDCDRRSDGPLGKVFNYKPSDDIEKMKQTVYHRYYPMTKMKTRNLNCLNQNRPVYHLTLFLPVC